MPFHFLPASENDQRRQSPDPIEVGRERMLHCIEASKNVLVREAICCFLEFRLERSARDAPGGPKIREDRKRRSIDQVLKSAAAHFDDAVLDRQGIFALSAKRCFELRAGDRYTVDAFALRARGKGIAHLCGERFAK